MTALLRTLTLLTLAAVAGGCSSLHDVPAARVSTVERVCAFERARPRQLELRFRRGLAIVETGERLACEVLVDVVGSGGNGTRDLARRIAPRVDEDRGTGVTTIGIERPADAPLDALYTRYLLTVPARVPVRITTEAGRVCLRDLSGRVEVTTAAGAIEARLGGGSAELVSGSGPITLSGLFEDATLRTESGRMQVALPGSGTVAPSVDMTTHTGKVLVDVPPGIALGLEFRGDREQLQSELPLHWARNIDETGRRHARVGVPGAPDGAHLSLDVLDGGVTLRSVPTAMPGR